MTKYRIVYPKRSLMERLDTPKLAVATLVAFIALVSYAYPSEHGYTEKERAELQALYDRVDKPMTPAETIVYLYGGEE